MSGPGEETVNVAAEINKLRGELNTAVARVEGRFGAGQQVMLSLSTDMKRLEATVRESMQQSEEALSTAMSTVERWQTRAEKKCETCHKGLLTEIGTVKRDLMTTKLRQVFVAGAGAGIIGLIDVILRAPAWMRWLAEGLR